MSSSDTWPIPELSGWRAGHVREQLHERTAGDPVAHLRRAVVEQLVQCLLGVTERALEMWIVAAPHDVGEAHRPIGGWRRLVVLERRVDLAEQDLLGQPGKGRPNEHAVLPVALVHPVP